MKVPQFDADSAYKYIQAQVDFGPRTPNSKGHVACGDYLAAKLAEHGAKVISQNAELPAYDGTLLKARNIIGSFKPESKKRIALFAHWDTRPWADNDPNEKNHHTPILGANDGASGVGVLLEIARQINQQQPELGIDIIFLDAEDYGAPQFYTGEHREDQWCLGAQYWARTPHVEAIMPASEFYSIWWAAKMLLSLKKYIPRNMPKVSTRRYGKRLTTPDTDVTLLTK